MQPQKSAAAVGNAMVNALLCGIYNSKKNCCCKVFCLWSLLSQLTSLLISFLERLISFTLTLHTHLHCCYQCCLFARFTKKLVQMIAYHSLFFHFDRLKGLLVCNFISIPPKKVQINKFEIFYSVSTKLLKTHLLLQSF